MAVDGLILSSGRTDCRAIFIPTTKQAAPAIAVATASQRKGLRHVANNSGRSNLKVRLRYAKNALVNPRAAPTANTSIASANGLAAIGKP